MYREQRDEPLDRFYAQFEWDGTDAIYRGNQVGPAYRVTNDEYHRFVEDHDRRRRWVNWTSLLAGFFLLAVVFFVPPFSTFPSESPTWAVMFCAAFFSPLLSWAFARRWLRFAPARALHDRTPVAAALTKDERLIVWAGNHPWGPLRSLAFVSGVWILNYLFLSDSRDRHSSLRMWAIAFWCVMLAVTMAQMLRKWRIERHHGIASHTANTLT